MNRLAVGAVLVSLGIAGCSATRPVLTVKPGEHFELGWTPRSVLESRTYAWFDSGYAAYQPQADCVERLKAMKDDLEITIVYGAWCPDSRREMPRFFKIMDQMGFPGNLITMIATDRSKRLPEGVPEKYGVTHVPTFILNFRGVEAGRIVEIPKKTLEEDLLEILSPFHQ
jgi:thiol-disulfide isomerase/thioredoxin